MSTKYNKDPFSFPLKQYPIAFLDYICVTIIYCVVGFMLALLIDGYLIPPLNKEQEIKDSIFIVSSKAIFQITLQGFVAIFLCALLEHIPSPFQGIYGYNYHDILGILIRNPAIITVLLFYLSTTLRERLLFLFNRFDNGI
jgi:integral membrane sensor domain MASE1